MNTAEYRFHTISVKDGAEIRPPTALNGTVSDNIQWNVADGDYFSTFNATTHTQRVGE